MSVLVHQGTPFSCTNVVIDPEGRYFFLLCSLYRLRCVLAGVYIPPPFSAELLKALATFMARHSDLLLLVVGDFNKYLDPVKDKLIAQVSTPLNDTGPTCGGRPYRCVEDSQP